MRKWIDDKFAGFLARLMERFPRDLPEDEIDWYGERPSELTAAIRFGLTEHRKKVLGIEPADPLKPVKSKVSLMKTGDIVEFGVNCDQHTLEYVAKLRGFTGDYQGERLTGRHWFKVQLLAAPRFFTDEEAVQWAKDECGEIGVLPGQVAEAFRQKFLYVARIGIIPFSGGFWRQADGSRLTVCLKRDGRQSRSRLGDRVYSPTFRWGIGYVFPVILEHKQL